MLHTVFGGLRFSHLKSHLNPEVRKNIKQINHLLSHAYRAATFDALDSPNPALLPHP
jgi:hypothetical protein